MGACCVFGNGFQSIIALSSPSLFSSFPISQPASNRNRRIHKFRSSTSVATKLTTNSIPCTKLGEFQNVLTGYISANQFPVSHRDRKSAILQIQESSDLASALARHGEILKVQDVNVILRYFGKLSRRRELYQVFDWMQQNQKINVASYSSYVKFMGKSLSCIEAVEIYRSIKDRSTKFNVSVCNAFLSSLIKNGKSESSLQLFTQMKRDGLVPDVVTYSTLLAGCVKVKDGYHKALELVQELISNGLQMDSVTYGSLLSVCASHKKCNEAAKYFQKMKDEGHSPNVYHYSSLLNAYSADRNCEKAESLIEEMRSAGLVLNKVIYTTLLKVYVKGGLFEKSKELLKELEALGYAKDENHISTMEEFHQSQRHNMVNAKKDCRHSCSFEKAGVGAGNIERWRIIPSCIRWTILKERNDRCFEDRSNLVQKIKLINILLFRFWCTKLNSGDTEPIQDVLDTI